MEGAVDFIFMSILLYIGLFFVKGRWLYKDGGYSFKKILIIEIISFILQECFCYGLFLTEAANSIPLHIWKTKQSWEK